MLWQSIADARRRHERLTPSTPPEEGGYLVWYIAAIPADAAENLLNIEWPYQGGEAVMPI